MLRINSETSRKVSLHLNTEEGKETPNSAPSHSTLKQCPSAYISHQVTNLKQTTVMFRLASSHTQRKLGSAGKLLCEQKKTKTFSETSLTYRWHKWRFWREPMILHTLKVPLRPFKHPWGLKVQSVTNWWAPNQPVYQVSLEDLKHTKTNKQKHH